MPPTIVYHLTLWDTAEYGEEEKGPESLGKSSFVLWTFVAKDI